MTADQYIMGQLQVALETAAAAVRAIFLLTGLGTLVVLVLFLVVLAAVHLKRRIAGRGMVAADASRDARQDGWLKPGRIPSRARFRVVAVQQGSNHGPGALAEHRNASRW
jgi:hypothetical protein